MIRASAETSWISAGATHAGRVRQANEDAYLDRPDFGLWAVADGMGGHAAGSLASRLVVDALETVSPQPFLGRSVMDLRYRLQDANRRLRAEAEHRVVRVIGSTVAVLLAMRGHCVLLWVGDSRVYRLRDEKLVRLSRDHSYVQELIDQGMLSGESADSHPAANVVTRAVGADDDLLIDSHIYEIENGDRFLLCTDGLNKEVSEPEIADFLAASPVKEVPKALVESACARGARDNVTVVVVEFSLSCP